MINEKNFFSENKKINVSNTSSLVNLKAELFKKKQDALKYRSHDKDEYERINATKNVSQSKWNRKAVQLDQKVRDSVKKKKNAKNLSEEDDHLEKELKKSRENLERKSKIYEEKLKNAYDSLMNKERESDEEEDDDLIDFERKIIDASKDGLKLFADTNRSTTSTGHASADPEEMVEYQDSFGRTRYCKRSELNKIEKLTEQDVLRRKLDRDLSKDEEQTDRRAELYPDLYSNFVKPVDEEQSESKESHYQTVSKDEIREHGTSYYQFSFDEEERKRQMQDLDKQRSRTIEQRTKADELAEKRGRAIKERLLKLAKRKGLVVEDDLSDSEIDEKMKLDQYVKSVPRPVEAKASSVETDYSIELKDRKLREWDKDKDGLDHNVFIIDTKGSDCPTRSDERDSDDWKRDSDDWKRDSDDWKCNSDDGNRNFAFAPPNSYDSKASSSNRHKKLKTVDQTVEDKVDQFLGQFN